MRASAITAALFTAIASASYAPGYGSSSALAPEAQQGPATITSTSTQTNTVFHTMTQTLTRNSGTSSAVAPVSQSQSVVSIHPSQAASYVTVSPATSAAPAQVTTNAAARGQMDVALAGLAGAAVYLIL